MCVPANALRWQLVLRWVIVLGGGIATVLVLVWGFGAEDWRVQRVLLLYNAPTCAAGAWWLYLRVGNMQAQWSVGIVLDAVVFVVALLRALPFLPLPFSGHMLFLVYSLLTTRSAAYRWVAAVLVLETTVFKLVVWGDWYTWSIGVICACVLAFFYGRWAAQYKHK